MTTLRTAQTRPPPIQSRITLTRPPASARRKAAREPQTLLIAVLTCVVTVIAVYDLLLLALASQ